MNIADHSMCPCIHNEEKKGRLLTWQIRKSNKKKKVEEHNPGDGDCKGNPHPHSVMPEVVKVQDCCPKLSTGIRRVWFLPSFCDTAPTSTLVKFAGRHLFATVLKQFAR